MGKYTIDDLHSLIQSIKADLSKEISDYKEESKNSVAAINKSLEKMNKRITKLEKDNELLRNENMELRKDAEESASYSRRCNVIMVGVPYKPDEKIMDLVIKIGVAVKMQLGYRDFYAVHRLGKPKTPTSSPPLIVKFVCRHLRDDFATRVRAAKLTDSIFGENGKVNIYANDHLTRRKAALFSEALKLRKHGYRYVWSRGGQIYVRKEGEERKSLILTLEQVEKLKVPLKDSTSG